MEWYEHLYMGRKASGKRFRLIEGLRAGRPDPRAHVITPPQNGNNVLDILPAPMLLLPPYRDQNLLILGIGADYWEALEVAGVIVDEMYRQSGGFELSAWMKENSRM